MLADVIHWYYDTSILFHLVLIFSPSIAWYSSRCEMTWLKHKGFWDRDSEQSIFQRYCFKSIQLWKNRKNLKEQTRFAKPCFTGILSFGVSKYIKQDTFQKFFIMPQSLILSDYPPVYPNPFNTDPLMVHSSSNTLIKGIQKFVTIIEKLQKKFESNFRMVSGLPCEENLKIVSESKYLFKPVYNL